MVNATVNSMVQVLDTVVSANEVYTSEIRDNIGFNVSEGCCVSKSYFALEGIIEAVARPITSRLLCPPSIDKTPEP